MVMRLARPVVVSAFSRTVGRAAEFTSAIHERWRAAVHSMLSGAVMEVLFTMLALLIVSLAALPAWPYSHKWGYYPTSVCGVAVFIIAALVLFGRL